MVHVHAVVFLSCDLTISKLFKKFSPGSWRPVPRSLPRKAIEAWNMKLGAGEDKQMLDRGDEGSDQPPASTTLLHTACYLGKCEERRSGLLVNRLLQLEAWQFGQYIDGIPDIPRMYLSSLGMPMAQPVCRHSGGTIVWWWWQYIAVLDIHVCV